MGSTTPPLQAVVLVHTLAPCSRTTTLVVIPEAAPDSCPLVERRRPGRLAYTNPHLIALLRGRVVHEDDPAGPDRQAAAADSSGSAYSLTPLVLLAVVLWAVVGFLIRLVIRLIQQL